MQLIASACGQPQTNHVSLHEHPYTIPSLPPDEVSRISCLQVSKVSTRPYMSLKRSTACLFVHLL